MDSVAGSQTAQTRSRLSMQRMACISASDLVSSVAVVAVSADRKLLGTARWALVPLLKIWGRSGAVAVAES